MPAASTRTLLVCALGAVMAFASAGCGPDGETGEVRVEDGMTETPGETPAETPSETTSDALERISYGDAPQQVADLGLPAADAGGGPYPVIVFIHGGFWRNLYDLTLAEPQAADARSRGYATWNIEYRRVGDPGGGYPGTLDDVAAAIDHLVELDAPLDLDRVAVVGHSAGGHLALWAGQRDDPVITPALVVGQAPVADLTGSITLGRGAVVDFMGGGPGDLPEAYDDADPARRLPVRVPQFIVQGGSDTIVPRSFVEPYADQAGDGVEFQVFTGLGHFDVIDPASISWGAVIDAIETATA